MKVDGLWVDGWMNGYGSWYGDFFIRTGNYRLITKIINNKYESFLKLQMRESELNLRLVLRNMERIKVIRGRESTRRVNK